MSVTCTVFLFQAEDGIRDADVTGVQTCALPICRTTNPKVGGSIPSGRATFPRSWATAPRRVGPQCAGFVRDALIIGAVPRSEERRVGKEGRSRWSPYH